MEVLIEVYKPKARGKIETSFKEAWRRLERVDKIETLKKSIIYSSGIPKILNGIWKVLHGITSALSYP